MLGNIKGGVIRRGTSSSPGSGQVVGNVKDDVIREGTSSTLGSGRVIGSVKGGVVFKGSSSTAGSGTKLGRLPDYTAKGMERERDGEIVAAHHFLVKKFL